MIDLFIILLVGFIIITGFICAEIPNEEKTKLIIFKTLYIFGLITFVIINLLTLLIDVQY